MNSLHYPDGPFRLFYSNFTISFFNLIMIFFSSLEI